MRLLDARRLTGVNLDLDRPGAIAEVAFDAGDDAEAAIAAWHQAVARATHLLGWDSTVVIRRWHAHLSSPYRVAEPEPAGESPAAPQPTGAALIFAAPRDALYVAVDVTEWAIDCAQRHLRGETPRPADLSAWTASLAKEKVPHIERLQAAAHAHCVPLLLDDDILSLGAGPGVRAWPRSDAPAPEDVPWDSIGTVPIALITGTNGKTTTARLLARIAKTSGHVPGNTSTDGLVVDEQVVDPGDWTGPAAARTVLRDRRVTLAVLEVARGGILRRGLAVDRCDVACVTNVSADHLGEHGIDDLAGMARVKAVVTRVVKPGGRIVLGADPSSPTAHPGLSSPTAHQGPSGPGPSPLLSLETASLPAPVVWFSRDPDHPHLAHHRATGGEVWFVSRDNVLTRGRGDEPDVAVVPVADIPICFGGAATHNVHNALAAAAMAAGLGLGDEVIAAGLRSFSDNPGRAHLVTLNGVKLFLDFAHNPAGIAGLAPLFERIRSGGRLLVSLGVAGDRRDEDIRDIARAVASLRPDLVLTRDLEHYLRGREPGEVPALLDATFAGLGIASERVASEVAAIHRGLTWARPGDLIAILVHVDRDEVWAELRALGVDPGAPAQRSGG